MSNTIHLARLILHMYLALHSHPNPAFQHTLEYLACERGCANGVYFENVEREVIYIWQTEGGKK